MKKLLLVLLLLLIPCSIAFSQPLDMGVNAEIGYLTEWECFVAKGEVALYINPTGYIGGTFYVGLEVLMDLNDAAFTFAPYRDRYSVGATFNISVFYIDVQHYCIHPVLSNWNQFIEKAYAENCTQISVGWKVNMPYIVNHKGR